ncbi:unnamed protein product [Rotaria sordida]|nr:unnamed protein product [Rotaria sordida]
MTSDDQEKHHHHHRLQNSNDENSTLHSYKIRQRMNISSIVTKDENDESLIHYKKLTSIEQIRNLYSTIKEEETYPAQLEISCSRAPSAELQTYVSDVEQALSGILSCGIFLIKSKITD